MSLAAKPGAWSALMTIAPLNQRPALFEFKRYEGVHVAAVRVPDFAPTDLREFAPGDLQRGLESTLRTAINPPPNGARVPSWMGWPRAGDEPLTEWETAAAGWPVRCMVSHRVGRGGTAEIRGALSVRSGVEWPAGSLPLRPYWPGLAINTALYGLTPWCAGLAVGAVRRCRRRGRGWCVACGYDLGGDFAGGCPECGWGRAPA